MSILSRENWLLELTHGVASTCIALLSSLYSTLMYFSLDNTPRQRHNYYYTAVLLIFIEFLYELGMIPYLLLEEGVS